MCDSVIHASLVVQYIFFSPIMLLGVLNSRRMSWAVGKEDDKYVRSCSHEERLPWIFRDILRDRPNVKVLKE